MKIALLADIHAGFVALEAIVADLDQWRPDLVFVAGDIVNRGPRSRDCLDLVLDRVANAGWQAIRGNHERYLINVAKHPRPYDGLEEAIRQTVRWSLHDLGEIERIAALPTELSYRLEDGELRVLHASMRHDRDNITEQLSDAELRERIAPAPRIFGCGHTHRPVVRMVDQTLVVNAGSVGLPFDGDPRASYARITRHQGVWQAEIQRIAYDRVRARRDIEQSGLLDQGAAAQIILAEFDDARPYMASWMKHFHLAVVRGDLSAEESVELHLRHARQQRSQVDE
ncbi:MAG: metallophosphoesterase family protein [Roseiflexaceae bacterium]